MKQLSTMTIIQKGQEIGLKNSFSIIGCSLLWLLTFWIPYLNVGTTIAMYTLPIRLSKGGSLSPLEIFESKYRQRMGEWFIVMALMTIGIYIAFIFLIIPAIVISIAWMFAPLLVIDKGINPSEALSESNKATYGNKFQIFVSTFLVVIIFLVIGFGLSYLGVIGSIFTVVLYLLLFPILIGIRAYLYSELIINVNSSETDNHIIEDN